MGGTSGLPSTFNFPTQITGDYDCSFDIVVAKGRKVRTTFLRIF